MRVREFEMELAVRWGFENGSDSRTARAACFTAFATASAASTVSSVGTCIIFVATGIYLIYGTATTAAARRSGVAFSRFHLGTVARHDNGFAIT